MYEFRAASLEERKAFYRKFKIKRVDSFFRKRPQLLALDAGTDTGIIKDKRDKGFLFYLKYSELKDMIKSYVPEDIYYDRNIYKDPEKRLRELKESFFDENFLGQELAFDIDPENIECGCKLRYPRFCEKCLKATIKNGVSLANELKRFGFKKIKLVYTGRGCHVHVFDKRGYYLSMDERKELGKMFSKYPIDPWVSEGNINLIRLPYSLNGLVSRIVIPLSVKEAKRFDPITDKRVIPDFLRK
jgi:DNA primase catalytic subunit